MTFAFLWSIVLFIAIAAGARRFFPTRRQAVGVGAVGAVAFLLGSVYSPRHHFSPPPSQLPAVHVAVAPTPLAPPRDVAMQCHARATRGLASNAAGSLDGAIDTVRRTPVAAGSVLRPKQKITLEGWAIDSDGKSVATGVCLDVDRAIVAGARVLYGAARPDVAAAYKAPSVEGSGFEVVVPPQLLTPGKHVLSIVVIDTDGRLATLKSDRTFIVR
jgi:hypothetical protein